MQARCGIRGEFQRLLQGIHQQETERPMVSANAKPNDRVPPARKAG
jgi:hypothetical protein